MVSEYSPEVAGLIARAFTTGVETSISDVAQLLEMGDLPRLVAAARVVSFVEHFQLELVPPPSQGEYETVRVLRSFEVAGDAHGRVKSLLAQGEGHAVEFKGSLFCSMHDWVKKEALVEHPSLEGELLKTVCAFANSDGGDLFVGVTDEGALSGGIELDLKLKGWNVDKWQLHVQALLRDRFYEGAQILSYVRAEMVAFGDQSVFHVSVMPRATRSFVQRQKASAYEYFVRNGPRTDSLDLPNFYWHLMSMASS